jgi:erythronate-4-phosphate dehydrogenase
VRFIATATIGFDHLDTDYLNEAGIVWTNCPGCNATSVAQYVRNALIEAEREGIVKLSEASLGIVGYGHVGRAVCESLRPYVKEILLNDPPLENEEFLLRQATQASPNFAERRMKDEGFDVVHEPEKRGNPDSSLSTHHSTFKSLVDLASSCDIISFHTPLTAEGPYPTFHLANEKFFQSLKRKPLLINAARGGVVDEAALLDAMDKGLVRQAIIDTWEGEPAINRALLSKVFIGTPHIAGYSADGKANATLMALRALVRWQSSLGSIDIEPMFDIHPPLAQPERTGIFYSPTSDSDQLKESPQDFENLRGNYLLRRE